MPLTAATIRQNKKAALQEFLFGSTYGRGEVSPILDTSSSPRVKILEDQIDSLQQKIIQLEQNQTLQIKKALSELLKPSQAFKIDQQGDSTLKSNKGVYSLEIHPNLTEARAVSQQQDEQPISKSLSLKACF